MAARDVRNGNPPRIPKFVNQIPTQLAQRCPPPGTTVEECKRLRITYDELEDGMHSTTDDICTKVVMTMQAALIFRKYEEHDITGSL